MATKENMQVGAGAIYARISHIKDDDQTGVERQERICRETAIRLGIKGDAQPEPRRHNPGAGPVVRQCPHQRHSSGTAAPASLLPAAREKRLSGRTDATAPTQHHAPDTPQGNSPPLKVTVSVRK